MKKLMNFRPILFVASGLSFSIFSAYLFFMEKVVLGILVLSILLLVSISFSLIAKDRKVIVRNIIFLLILSLVSAIGFFSFTKISNDYKNATLYNEYYEVTGRVEYVVLDDNATRFIIDNVTVDGKVSGESKYKIFVCMYGESKVDVGDVVSFYGLIEDYTIIYDGRYRASNVVDKVKYSTSISAEDLTIEYNDKTIFEKVNVFMRETLNRGLDKEEFAVAYAMLCGNSDYIEVELLENYRYAGVAHVFAVSGLHIGFLAGVLMFLTKKLRINGYLNSLFIIVVLLFYSGVCGFSASSLRATLMCGILLLSSASGKRYDALTSVGFAGTIILISSPAQLFCAGFLLSFGVVLGIMLLTPPFNRLFKFLPKKIATAVSVVLSAFIISVPISLSLFGYFTLFSIIANLIFVPLVSVIFILTFFLTIISGIISVPAILLPINYIFKAVNYFVALLDYRCFIIGGFSLGIFVVAYYAIVIIQSDIINLKFSFKSVISAILVFILVIGTMLYNTAENNKIKAFVLGVEDFCSTVVISKEESVMIVSYANKNFSLGKLEKLTLSNGIEKLDKIYILNGENGIDVQVFCSRLNSIVKFDKVVYCGKDNQIELAVLEEAFKNTDFICAGEYGEYFDGNYKFLSNGYGISFNYNDKSCIVLSKFGEKYRLKESEVCENLDVVIAYDYQRRIENQLNAVSLISYLPHERYKDAHTFGNYIYNFK